MGKKLQVMIVDDQKSIRGLLKSIIENIGAEVVAEAENGLIAVEYYKIHKPHLVLMDINMPCMDGEEALTQIIKLNPKALVIMLTSLDSGDVIQDCIELGARNFLLKSNPPEEIAREIKETWADYVADLKAD